MSAEVVGGRVQFKFDLGSGPLTLISDKAVSDGLWQQVITERSVGQWAWPTAVSHNCQAGLPSTSSCLLV